MKKISKLMLVMMALTSVSAFADIPPPSGSSYKSEITDASSATMLAAFIGGKEVALPASVGTIEAVDYSGAKQTFTSGYVSAKDAGDSVVTLACVTYYSRGHQGKCVLVQEFK